MDLQTFFNVGSAILIVIVGGYIRFVQGQLHDARDDQKELTASMTAFRIEVAKEYVTHADLRRIEDALVRIEAKIDVKADRVP